MKAKASSPSYNGSSPSLANFTPSAVPWLFRTNGVLIRYTEKKLGLGLAHHPVIPCTKIIILPLSTLLKCINI